MAHPSMVFRVVTVSGCQTNFETGFIWIESSFILWSYNPSVNEVFSEECFREELIQSSPSRVLPYFRHRLNLDHRIPAQRFVFPYILLL
jgi:hypothetical protein